MTSLHYKCVVYRTSQIKSLPRAIRGQQGGPRRGFWGSALLVTAFGLLGLAIGAFLYFGVPPRSRGPAEQTAGSSHPVEPPAGTPATFLGTTTPSPAALAAVPPIVTFLPTATGIVDGGPGLATLLPTSTPGGGCGHRLDEPFGAGRQFVIHRVRSGDTLGLYEATYATTAAAIEAVNAVPVMPLPPDQVIVIPLYQKGVDGVPAFEAFQVYEQEARVSQVAAKLGASNVADFLFYNGYTFTQCPVFDGWILAPRDRARLSPTPICPTSASGEAVRCLPTATPTKRSH